MAQSGQVLALGLSGSFTQLRMVLTEQGRPDTAQMISAHLACEICCLARIAFNFSRLVISTHHRVVFNFHNDRAIGLLLQQHFDLPLDAFVKIIFISTEKRGDASIKHDVPIIAGGVFI